MRASIRPFVFCNQSVSKPHEACRDVDTAYRNGVALGASQFMPETAPMYGVGERQVGGLGYFGVHQTEAVHKAMLCLLQMVLRILAEPAPTRHGKGLNTTFCAPSLTNDEQKV
jgi:hypothetical protein